MRKANLTLLNRSITCLFISFAFFTTSISAQILSEDLSSGWRVAPADSAAVKSIETDDSQWISIDLPADLSETAPNQTGWVWIRRTINIDQNAGIYSLYLGQLSGKAEVYLNGVPAKPLRLIADGPAFYLLPTVDKSGSAILTIRSELRSGLSSGPIQNPILLTGLKNGLKEYYHNGIAPLSLALLYAGIGLFLLALSRELVNRRPTYRQAASFYLIVGLIGIGSSTAVLSSIPFVLSNVLNQFFKSLTILLPVPILFYLRSVLNRKDDQLQQLIFKLALPTACLFAALYFSLSMIGFELTSLWVYYLWLIILIPLWAVIFLIILRQTARKMEPTGFVLLAGLVYFIYAGFTSLLTGSFFKDGSAITTLLYAPAVLVPFGITIGSLFLSERQVQLHTKQVSSLTDEIIQSKLFSHISEALDTPIRAIIESITPDMANDEKKQALQQLKVYENQLDDILELGRLELLDEVEATVAIPALDFLSTILPGTGISHTVHVDSDLMIDTSLELVNSAIIRLIRFPGFQTFDHIDLIVTEDLNDRLHFRFLMHHRDRKQLRRIQDIVLNRLPDSEGLWIEWQIINETIRLLSGKLTAKVLAGKYLNLDMSLPGFHERQEKADGPAPLTLTLLHTEDSTAAVTKELTWIDRIRQLLQKEIA